jgi:hypothetical protein
MMMRAVANCIQRNINILHDNGHTTSLNIEPSNEAVHVDVINVGLIAETHYVSLVNIEVSETNVDSDHQSEVSVDEGRSDDWPSVWTSDVWLEKQGKYPFLKCCNGKLGCTTCSSVKNIQIYSGKGRNLADEWVKCQVEPYGKTRAAQLTSLRKKSLNTKIQQPIKAHRQYSENVRKNLLKKQ